MLSETSKLHSDMKFLSGEFVYSGVQKYSLRLTDSKNTFLPLAISTRVEYSATATQD